VNFEGTDRAYRLFQTRDFGRLTVSSPQLSELPSPVKVPGFLLQPESASRNFLASLKALCTRTKLPPSTGLKYFYSNGNLRSFRRRGVGIANSILLHVALISGIIFLPMALPTRAPALSSAFLPPEVIFYPVPEHRIPSKLPRIAPRGPGGRPGSGIHPDLAPDSGKTVKNGDLTVISKPLHPDNLHQTIIQPASPPDLRIPNDLQVPNLSLGTMAAPKKPNLDLSIKKPNQENALVAEAMATPLAETNADYSLATSLRPTNSQPKLPIPTGPMAKPTRRDAGAGGTTGPEAPEVGVAGDGRAILAIGIDPSGPSSGLALPPGNRYGDFSIAPGTGNSGSPGGRQSGVAGGGGSGGNGRAGDASVGLGPGHEGGGGGKNGSASSISIKGTGNSVGGNAAFDPRIEAKMVYPVLGALGTKTRRNGLIVSAGPMGGGGLNAYGALSCEKIYTIFLPMAGAGWTMQYCQKSGSTDAPKADPNSRVIRLEAALVPPDPDMDSRFDFKRVPVPPGKAEKLIELKGTMLEDGSIEGLEVYQGIAPQMDEAALIAFSRWKFKPAMRAGKPVTLEILVGIPPANGAAGESQ
jgi:hypothetical protein